MDISKTYIKMCEKAEEIQAIWHDLELIGIHPSDKGFGLHYEKGYDGSFYWDGRLVCCVDYEYETSYKKSDVWLPRQDQLQERLFQLGEGILAQVTLLVEYVKKYHAPFTTMEQLWLAFVMKEKYNKVWVGESWKATTI